ncbi:MAG: hypothetical protein U0R51_06290 [Solirubrobacterales bacterium]
MRGDAADASEQHRGDAGFFVWMLPSFLLVFGFIAQFSIGLPFFLAGILLFAYLYARGPAWPADLGLAAGLGLGLLLFWLLPTDFDPVPLVAIGVALIGFSSALFWHLRCRPSSD